MKQRPSKSHSCKFDRKPKMPKAVKIMSMSMTGERSMSTLTPVPGGFPIAGAHRVVANLVLSCAGGKASFQAKFKRAAASGANSMSCLLTRDLTDGSQQFSSVAISAPSGGDIEMPLGLFSGRQVIWRVGDMGLWRMLAIDVNSLDALGTGETWHLDLCVCVPANGTTDYDIRALTPTATVTSVDVTPPTI